LAVVDAGPYSTELGFGEGEDIGRVVQLQLDVVVSLEATWPRISTAHISAVQPV
jgi:hypothetical protein